MAGATAQQVEQFVTRRLKTPSLKIKTIHPGTAADYGIRSVSIPGYAYVYVQLAEDVSDVKRTIQRHQPQAECTEQPVPIGAGPISFQSDFGDTAALMLTIASPKATRLRLTSCTRDSIGHQTARPRRKTKDKERRSLSSTHFPNLFPRTRQYWTPRKLFERQAEQVGIIRATQLIQGSGFIAVDGVSTGDDASIHSFIQTFFQSNCSHPNYIPTLGNQSSSAISRKLPSDCPRSPATNTVTPILTTFRT